MIKKTIIKMCRKHIYYDASCDFRFVVAGKVSNIFVLINECHFRMWT